MNRKILYAGSFDPITKGHLDIITRAGKIFDSVIIGIAVNTRKKPLLTAEQRLELINEATSDLPNIIATHYEGMTVDYANVIGANSLLRGLRNPSDFHLEFQMAITNRTLAPELETIFFTSTPAYAFINSCLVREIAKSGGDISPFLPKSIVIKFEKMMAAKGIFVNQR